jgi:hypothetical protein
LPVTLNFLLWWIFGAKVSALTLSTLLVDLPTTVWQVHCQATHRYGTYPVGVAVHNSLKIVDSYLGNLYILYVVIVKGGV